MHKFALNDVSVSTVLSKIVVRNLGCLVPLDVLRLKAVGGLGTRLRVA